MTESITSGKTQSPDNRYGLLDLKQSINQINLRKGTQCSFIWTTEFTFRVKKYVVPVSGLMISAFGNSVIVEFMSGCCAEVIGSSDQTKLRSTALSFWLTLITKQLAFSMTHNFAHVDLANQIIFI